MVKLNKILSERKVNSKELTLKGKARESTYKMKKSKFKTKEEYEEEDSENHRKRMENIQKKRDLKRTEGFSCKADGCGQKFEDFLEFDAHCKKHQEDNRKKMICNKSQCKDLKVRARVAQLGQNIDIVVVFSSKAEGSITSTLRNTRRRPSRK